MLKCGQPFSPQGTGVACSAMELCIRERALSLLNLRQLGVLLRREQPWHGGEAAALVIPQGVQCSFDAEALRALPISPSAEKGTSAHLRS